jgi:hypothetical protein
VLARVVYGSAGNVDRLLVWRARKPLGTGLLRDHLELLNGRRPPGD